MNQTYFQIYIHLVFSVKDQKSFIHPNWEGKLYQFLSETLKSLNQHVIAINGMPDHIHIFISLKPNIRISTLARSIKISAANFINSQNFCKNKFEWQSGYGAFSHNHSKRNLVRAYINNQKSIHKTKSFKTEYISFLKHNDIQYKEQNLSSWLHFKGSKKLPISSLDLSA